ncbi:MAG: decaprenyl-phosphate phosphoribosyltransferase [Gammaproteobacteria bacterium]
MSANLSAIRHTASLALLTLMRPHQWVKNAFVLAPLFFTPAAVSTHSVFIVLTGMLVFCALSSAVYILNDYADRGSDRLHPEKCHRPLAAGTVTVITATTLLGFLVLVGLSMGFMLSRGFFMIALCYLALNLAYSLWLKHVSIVDIVLIAIGFILRVEAGSALIQVRPSVWILVCTSLLALFLAVAKRRDDLVQALGNDHRKSLKGYNLRFVDTVLVICLSALLVSYTIYTTDANVMERLGTDHLYFTVPFVFCGVLRYLQVTMVEERSGSPTKILISDRFLHVTVFGWILVFGMLIYG